MTVLMAFFDTGTGRESEGLFNDGTEGPNNYMGEDMWKGHAHRIGRGLNDFYFDVVMENMRGILKGAAIAESTRNEGLGK